MQIAHGGGLRFKPNSLEYRIISEWIAAGTPPPSSKDKEVVSLQVEPAKATLAIGANTQLKVTAQYSDNSTADVTRWVKYNSNNEGVATVDDSGKVKMNGSGEAAITLWYSSRVLYATMTSPYPNMFRRRSTRSSRVRTTSTILRSRSGKPEHPAVRRDIGCDISSPGLPGCRRHLAHRRRGRAVSCG